MLTRIADFLEREGGSVVAAFWLLFIGWGMWFTKFPKAEDVVMIAVGALAMALKGKASRITTPPPVAEGTSSHTITNVPPAPPAPEVKP